MTNNYFGGVPTDIDIKSLREAFPDEKLIPGFFMSHEDVGNVIKVAWGTHRYRTVTTRWRKIIEKDLGVVIGVLSGEGFKVLDNGEKIDLGASKQQSGIRMTRRGYRVLGRVDTAKLTENQRAKYDHVAKRSVAILQAAKTKSRAALPDIEKTANGDK